MPGPAHKGSVYVEQWVPGAGTPGARQTFQPGGFSSDMVLISIVRDRGDSGAATSQATLRFQQAAGLHSYEAFSRVLTNSVLFDPENTRELGIIVPAGSKLLFEVDHQGNDDVAWLFYWANP